MGLHGHDDGIDDQCTYVRDRRRQHARHQGKQGEAHRQGPTGRPHEVEGAPAVLEYAEEAAARAGCLC